MIGHNSSSASGKVLLSHRRRGATMGMCSTGEKLHGFRNKARQPAITIGCLAFLRDILT